MFAFLEKLRGEKKEWRKVSDLSVGMEIARPRADIDGSIEPSERSDDIEWDEIVSIKPVGREQVWDIEVEGTHNFVGNGIFAHNTYLLRADPSTGVVAVNGLVGIGTDTPLHALDVRGAVSADEFIAPLPTDSGSLAALPATAMTVDGKGVDLFKLATYNLSGVQLLTTLSLKTDQDITTLKGLQDSVDGLLTVIGNKLAALAAKDETIDARFLTDESHLTALETLADQLQTDMNTEVGRTALLEKQMTALLTFYTDFKLDNLIAKDASGNVDISGGLLGGKLKATILETGALTIDVIDAEAPTIGTVEVLPVAVDADSDGNDDITGAPMTDPDVVARDGMSIIVSTKAITDMSRIFATPNTADPVVWSIADRKQGISFTLKLLAPVSQKVRFDWWLAEQK